MMPVFALLCTVSGSTQAKFVHDTRFSCFINPHSSLDTEIYTRVLPLSLSLFPSPSLFPSLSLSFPVSILSEMSLSLISALSYASTHTRTDQEEEGDAQRLSSRMGQHPSL